MKMDAWKSISISIHTLHTEGDTLTIHYMDDTDISIHTLHTEGDIIALSQCRTAWKFQSTPSTRRVTWKGPSNYCHVLHFNPHPPHGG